MKYLQCSVVLETTKDNYENGEELGGNCFGEIDTINFDTKEDFQKILERYAYKPEPYIFDDRIEMSIYQDDDGQEVTTDSLLYSKFKSGEIDLYVARYSFYINEMECLDVDNTKLQQIFSDIRVEL